MDKPSDVPQETEPIPARCPRCTAELTPCRGNMPLGAVGALLAVAGISACGILLLKGETEWLPAGVVAFIFGIEMTGDRMWWECPDCGRQFTRLPPPPSSGGAPENPQQQGHPDAQEDNFEAD